MLGAPWRGTTFARDPKLDPWGSCQGTPTLPRGGGCGCVQLVRDDNDPIARLSTHIAQFRTGRHEDIRQALLARYGAYASASMRPPIRVASRQQWVELVGPGDIKGLFLYNVTLRIGPAGVLVPDNAPRSVIFHELVHGYTASMFWTFGGADRSDLSTDSQGLRESFTEFLTQQAGYTENVEYGSGVALIRRMQIPEGIIERAVFQGIVGPLQSAINAYLGRPNTRAPFDAFPRVRLL